MATIESAFEAYEDMTHVNRRVHEDKKLRLPYKFRSPMCRETKMKLAHKEDSYSEEDILPEWDKNIVRTRGNSLIGTEELIADYKRGKKINALARRYAYSDYRISLRTARRIIFYVLQKSIPKEELNGMNPELPSKPLSRRYR